MKTRSQELEKLKAKKLKLIVKAFKQFPNSPAQLKTRTEIEKLAKKIELIEKQS